MVVRCRARRVSHAVRALSVWNAGRRDDQARGGTPAYVAAHHIAVVDGRLPFEQAYCLSRPVIDYCGGPFAPERAGPMSWKVLKLLAADNLVLVTSEFSEHLRPAVELANSALLIEELGSVPPAGVRITGFTPSRRRIERYVEASELGADLVAAAVRASAQELTVRHRDDGGS